MLCSPFQRQSPGNYWHILRKTHGQQHLWSEDSRVSHFHPFLQSWGHRETFNNQSYKTVVIQKVIHIVDQIWSSVDLKHILLCTIWRPSLKKSLIISICSSIYLHGSWTLPCWAPYKGCRQAWSAVWQFLKRNSFKIISGEQHSQPIQ